MRRFIRQSLKGSDAGETRGETVVDALSQITVYTLNAPPHNGEHKPLQHGGFLTPAFLSLMRVLSTPIRLLYGSHHCKRPLLIGDFVPEKTSLALYRKGIALVLSEVLRVAFDF